MAYSTSDQLKSNVKMLENTFTGTDLSSFITDRITLADKIVKVDLSGVVSMSAVPDDETTPVVNLLSQFKSAEMSLRRLAGLKRTTTEVDDISEWERLYNDLLNKVLSGAAVVLDDNGNSLMNGISTITNTARPNTRPAFGYDRYGHWIGNDDLTDLRGDVTDTGAIEDGDY